MTLEKAIEILEFFLKDNWRGPEVELNDALNLGIQALKAVEFTRDNNFRLPLGLLPGETKD